MARWKYYDLMIARGLLLAVAYVSPAFQWGGVPGRTTPGTPRDGQRWVDTSGGACATMASAGSE